MRILVTGHNGYVGSVMLPALRAAGHEVSGLDTYFFADCTFGKDDGERAGGPLDLRDVRPEQLEGFDGVVHLAALSNDPLGNLHASTTYDINHQGSVNLARAAKAVGASRFVFASSCSLYGVAAGSGFLDESAAFNPITPYGESKVLVERDVALLASDDFSPTFMRNATAYGVSPRLRLDVVINNLVGHAVTSGKIRIESDGTPWRPLVHVEDFCAAFVAVLEAPRERVHNEAFNVGRTEENYRVSELAEMVAEVVPGSKVTYADGGGPDPRSYRVNCDKLPATLPGFRPSWTVRDGVRQLYEAYQRHGLSPEQFAGSRYFRIRRIKEHLAAGRLDASLRWRTAAPVGAGAS